MRGQNVSPRLKKHTKTNGFRCPPASKNDFTLENVMPNAYQHAKRLQNQLIFNDFSYSIEKAQENKRILHVDSLNHYKTNGFAMILIQTLENVMPNAHQQVKTLQN